MKKFILVLLIGSTVVAKAQTEKKVRLNDSSQVIYHVNDQGSKDGLYTIKNLSNDGVWVQGAYHNGQRTKSWNFFSKDFNLVMRYDYEHKKLVYIDKNALKNAAVRIISDSEDVAKGASASLPLCSVDCYKMLALQNLPANADNNFDTIEITAHVAEDGSATYSVVYLGNETKSQPIFFSIPKDKFAIEWLPAKYQQKPVNSEFVVYSSSFEQANYSGLKRVRWDN